MRKILILEMINNETRRVLYNSSKATLAEALDDYQNNFNKGFVCKTSDGNAAKSKDGFVIEVRWA